MNALEQAFVWGMLSGALMAVPTTLILNALIPRLVDAWVKVVRRIPRPNAR